LIQLAPGQETSDNVINVFAEMLCFKEFSNSVKVFPSELFTRMFIRNGGKYRYESVSRWHKEECILQHDLLIFPVFVQSGHWAIVAVYVSEREMYYLDSKNFGGGDKILKCIFRYLYDESLKHCVPMKNLNDWKLYYKGIGVKQQGKNLNCGIFTLIYIDMLTRGFPINLVEDNFAKDYRYYVSTCFIQSGHTTSEPVESGKVVIDMTGPDPLLKTEDVIKEDPLLTTDAVDKETVALGGSKLLKGLRPVKINSPTETIDFLVGKGVDPFEYAERMARENSLYVAKYYNSKPVHNAGDGLCFFVSTSQSLTQSGIRSRSEVTSVSLKSSLKLGMVQNEPKVRELLSESRCIPPDRDTKSKFKNWVNKTVDDWTHEHVIAMAACFWNIRFEIICDSVIHVYDSDSLALPVPSNVLKETVRIVFNMVNHYQAIEELSDSSTDKNVKQMVKDMEIPVKLLV
jgi:hypothetical protein